MKLITIAFLILFISSNNLFAQSDFVVKFDLNYEGAGIIQTINVKSNGILTLNQNITAERPGFRFAGWYKNADCKRNEEWLLGKMAAFPMPGAPDSSMLVTESMTLFARWVSPVHINDASGLAAMQNDLKGWYVLDKDINLAGYADWTPVGDYNPSYEFARGEWWRKAFQGIFDGQGHTISNLNLTNSNRQMKALFGAVANGEILNVRIDNCRIDLNSAGNYASPIVGILKEDNGNTAKIENCIISNLQANVDFSYGSPNHIFSAVTGLAAGVWNGTVINCHVSGVISLAANGIGGTGGELYVGGIMGEGYSNTIGCSSDIDISISVNVSPLNKGQALKLFVGGLQASATNVKNAISTGDIKIEGCPSITELYVGGLIGSERYGIIENCASQGKIFIKNVPIAQIGGIVGEFSKTYGGIGPAFGIKETILRKCYASGEVSTFQVDSIIRGGISGSGKPQPLKGYGGTMDYSFSDCAFVSPLNEDFADKQINEISMFKKANEIKGLSLKQILGDEHWHYKRNSLPYPKK